MEQQSNKIIMGRFASPYGVHGWIKVVSHTSPLTNLLDYPPWYIADGDQWQIIQIKAAKPHGKFLVIQVADFDAPETVRILTNKDIYIDREKLPLLAKEEYYWTDLIGLKVINKEGVELGIVEELLETGANDVLVLSGDRRRLLPYIKAVIQSIDLDDKLITVDWDPSF